MAESWYLLSIIMSLLSFHFSERIPSSRLPSPWCRFVVQMAGGMSFLPLCAVPYAPKPLCTRPRNNAGLVISYHHISLLLYQVYPFRASANTHTFIPHLWDFLGRYCKKERWPLKALRLSSMERKGNGMVCSCSRNLAK